MGKLNDVEFRLQYIEKQLNLAYLKLGKMAAIEVDKGSRSYLRALSEVRFLEELEGAYASLKDDICSKGDYEGSLPQITFSE